MPAVIIGLGSFITLGILFNYAVAKFNPWYLLISLLITYYAFVGIIIGFGMLVEKIDEWNKLPPSWYKTLQWYLFSYRR